MLVVVVEWVRVYFFVEIRWLDYGDWVSYDYWIDGGYYKLFVD